MTDKYGKAIRLTNDTLQHIEKNMKGRESYDVTIRRLLKLPYRRPYSHKETK